MGSCWYNTFVSVRGIVIDNAAMTRTTHFDSIKKTQALVLIISNDDAGGIFLVLSQYQFLSSLLMRPSSCQSMGTLPPETALDLIERLSFVL